MTILENNKRKIKNTYFFWTLVFIVVNSLFFSVIATNLAYSGTDFFSVDTFDVYLSNKIQWSIVSLLLIFSIFSTYLFILLMWFSYKYRKNNINQSEMNIINLFVSIPSYFWFGKTDYSVRYLVENEKTENFVNWNVRGRKYKEFFPLLLIMIELVMYVLLIVFVSKSYSNWESHSLEVMSNSSKIYQMELVESTSTSIGASLGDYIFTFDKNIFILLMSSVYLASTYFLLTITFSLLIFSGRTKLSSKDIFRLFADIYNI